MTRRHVCVCFSACLLLLFNGPFGARACFFGAFRHVLRRWTIFASSLTVMNYPRGIAALRSARGQQSRVVPCTGSASLASRGHLAAHVLLAGLPIAMTAIAFCVHRLVLYSEFDSCEPSILPQLSLSHPLLILKRRDFGVTSCASRVRKRVTSMEQRKLSRGRLRNDPQRKAACHATLRRSLVPVGLCTSKRTTLLSGFDTVPQQAKAVPEICFAVDIHAQPEAHLLDELASDSENCGRVSDTRKSVMTGQPERVPDNYEIRDFPSVGVLQHDDRLRPVLGQDEPLPERALLVQDSRPLLASELGPSR